MIRLTAVFLAVLVAVTPFSPIRAQAPIRVMPLGDSITYGFGAPGSYRRPLCAMLPAGTITFVGSLESGETACGNWNEGHVGWISKSWPYYPNDTQEMKSTANLYDYVQGWIAQSPPDIVLLAVGTNDVGRGATVETYRESMRSLVERILASNTKPKIIVATLPPFYTGPSTMLDLSGYNAAIKDVVRTARNAGYPVYLADIAAAGLSYPDDYSDYYHPNAAGGVKMAAKWHEALAPIIGEGGQMATATPGAGPTVTKADLNGNGRVDIIDLSILLSDWNGPGPGDINDDGKVTITDLSILMTNWSQ